MKNWQKAQEIVVYYENTKNRTAKLAKNHFTDGYDIKSVDKDGDVRLIEVKSKLKGKMTWTELTPNETISYKNNIKNYWLYLVEGDCLNDLSVSITEVSPKALNEMAIDKEIVRFSSLSKIKRIKVNATIPTKT